MEKFKDVVYNAREASGLSQQALGEMIGIWGTYVGQIEKGRRIPADELIEKLAKILNLNAETLLITAYCERTDSKVARRLFGKIHRFWTQNNNELDLAKLTVAQQNALITLYNHWIKSQRSPLTATAIVRLCNMPEERKDTVEKILKAFDT